MKAPPPVPRALMLKIAAETPGRHLAPLCVAVALHGIVLVIIAQGDRTLPSPPRKRWVAIVGDDPPSAALGPKGFCSLKPLFKQATLVAVCSGAPVAAAYAAAAAIAANGGRVVLIETKIERHAEWWDLAQRLAPKARLLDVTPVGGTA